MNAIDANVLVRFLVRDDVKQAGKVRKLFEDAELSGASFFVCTPVVLELIWVLKSVYDFSRDDIISTFEKMLKYSVLEFEDRVLMSELVETGRNSKIDLPDLLIVLNARHCGCEKTLTFDKDASKSNHFKLII